MNITRLVKAEGLLESQFEDFSMPHPSFDELGLEKKTIAEFGLVYCKRGAMRGQIMIPVYAASELLVAYIGYPPSELSQLNAPQYKIPRTFPDSAELFNLQRAKHQPAFEPLIIVKSVLEVLKLWQMGKKKAIALLGNGKLSHSQEELLVRHFSSHTRILLMFNANNEGRVGRQVMLRLCDRFYVRLLKLPTHQGKPEYLTTS